MIPRRSRRPAPVAAPVLALLACLACLACTGPRSVWLSPEAVPKGEFRAGGGVDANLPTQTSEALFGGLESGIEHLYKRASGDTARVPITADSLNELTRALLAYSLDPLGLHPSLFLRYGLWHRLDMGYRFAGGVHALDARVQFLGPTDGRPGWRGSVGAQYSSQDYELPSLFGKLQKLLRYEFKRKDILVPVVFGKPLGADGRYGSFGLGGVYNAAFIEYGSEILRLVEKVDGGAERPFEDLHGERSIHSFGGFANARLGYRWIYALGSLAVYRQDYGSFPLFGGEETHLAGWTFAPTLGFEVRF
jgi:hypothetical protein